MKPIIYIDVLFAVNFLINLLLILTTAKIGRLPYTGIRMTAAAILGALYAVFMFFPNLDFVYTSGAKLIFSCLAVAVAYNISGIKLYLKALCIFYLVTFSFGGGVFAVCSFTDIGAKTGMLISNGVIYMNLPWQILFLSVGISYLVIRIVTAGMKGRMSRENMFIGVSIFLDGKRADVNALLDTGNALYDPITGTPVIIAEYATLLEILPEQFKNVIEKTGEIPSEDLYEAARSSNIKLRLIPFSSLGKENGMLIGFKPDKVAFYENEQTKTVNNVIVGICLKTLAKDKSYHALLHPEVISN